MKSGNLLFRVGVLITLAWLATILVLIISSVEVHWIDVRPLAFSELGDFFAGVFGPLAILWVILGFIQQGAELRNSVAELAKLSALAKEQIEQNSAERRRKSELENLFNFRYLGLKYRFRESIDILRKMEVSEYQDYINRYDENERDLVVSGVEFLNFISVMVRSKHIEKQKVWDVYFMVFRLFGTKLDDWWFENERRGYPNRFLSAQEMMREVTKITDEEIEEYDRKKG